MKAGEVGLGADNDRVQVNLILETIDIVGGMRVNVLERLCELIVQTVNESNKGALDIDGLTILGDTVLIGLLLLFWDILFDNVVGACLQDGQQAVQVLVSTIFKKIKQLLIIVQLPKQSTFPSCINNDLLLPEGNAHVARSANSKVELG